MVVAHVLRDGGALDDREHALAHAVQEHEQHHQGQADRAGTPPGREQQGGQPDRDQARNRAVGHMHVEPVLEEEQHEAAQDLDHADAGRHRNGPGLAHATLAQQAHHVGRQRCGDGHRQHHEHADIQEGRARQQAAQRDRSGRARRGSCRTRCVAQQGQVDRQADPELQRCQCPQGVAPAQGGNQPGRERNEDRAGQAAEKGHRDDGAPEIGGEPARDDGKHRRVQGRGHGDAEQGPDRIEAGQAGDQAVRHQAQAGQCGAQGHHPAFVAAIDPASDQVGAQALDQQREAERHRRLRARHTELGLDRPDQQREGVEDAAPGDQLGQRQAEDQARLASSCTAAGVALRKLVRRWVARITARLSAQARPLPCAIGAAFNVTDCPLGHGSGPGAHERPPDRHANADIDSDAGPLFHR